MESKDTFLGDIVTNWQNIFVKYTEITEHLFKRK